MPRVSIVLLSWNQSRFIEACLDSIARQSFRDFDVIAIDNGSSDGSADLIEEHGASLGLPLVLIRNASNEGIPRALNKALQSATGEFIVPFAADDIMLPHRLEEQVRHLDECGPQYSVVSGDVALIDSDGEPFIRESAVWLDPSGELRLTDSSGTSRRECGRVYRLERSTWLLDESRHLEHILAIKTPHAPTAMFRSSTYSTIGLYDESLAIEDFDYWLRTAQRSRIAYKPGVVTLYRRHSGQTTWRHSFVWDSVLESLSRVDPDQLNSAELAALEASLTMFRYRCGVAGVAEALPDARRRLFRVVRDPTQGTRRRLGATLGVLHPRLLHWSRSINLAVNGYRRNQAAWQNRRNQV